MVAASKSSSCTSGDASEEHKMFSCSSCPRKFLSQHAMAGHRNIHRSEWESLLQNLPDEGKIQHPKLPCKPKPSFPNVSSTTHNPLPCAHSYPLASATNILQEPLVKAPVYSFRNHPNILRKVPPYPFITPISSLKHPSPCVPLVNPTNTLKGRSPSYNSLAIPRNLDTLTRSSLGAPDRYTFFQPTKTIRKPLVAHPTLGVRRLSMIHKPCQLRQDDMWSTIGRIQKMEGNIRRFGDNNNNVYLKSLLTAEGAPSSSHPEGGSSSEARDFFSLPFRAQERHNHDIGNTSRGLTMQRDKNGENRSSLDIDLDLKL